MQVPGGEGGRVRLIGFPWSPRAYELRDFLARSRVPYRWMDYERSTEARDEARAHGVDAAGLPLLVFPDGSALADPSDEEIAERLGLRTEAESPFYDLVIVGAGPAGLAAAVYGASEGLRTVLIDREMPGGQAGLSASIENYLGFPGGLGGNDLARRGLEQAEGFGAEVVVQREAVALAPEDGHYVVSLDDGGAVRGHAVLLAMGVSWRLLEAPGCDRLVGRGVYYGAAAAAEPTCAGEDVYLLGGGNSAGQAAVYLARSARSVTLVAPEPDFAEKMSEYLLDRIRRTSNIRLRPRSTVTGAEGSDALTSLTLKDVETGDEETVETRMLYVYIGGSPPTDWLADVLPRDDAGFVLTGAALEGRDDAPWDEHRPRMPLESALPGVFVAGDVRAGSVKRVGAAAGEGAVAIQHVHDFLRA